MSKTLPAETVAQTWEEFAERILVPLGIGPQETQYIETRRAFYAGSQAMLVLVKGVSDRYDEEQACRVLDAVELEFHRWGQDLRNRRV